MPGSIPSLDGARALAVLAVLLTHVGYQSGATAYGTTGALLARLDIGVTLFFLLSGFLLYRPFVAAHFGLAPAPNAQAYLRNRALRILPAYWALVVVALPLLSPDAVDVGEFVRQLLFLQTTTAGGLHHGLTQTWSLVVEVAFYLVLPLLALAAAPRPTRPRSRGRQLRAELVLLVTMVLTAVTWQIAVHGYRLGDERVTSLWLPAYLDWFALGMGLAVVEAWRRAGGHNRALADVTGASGTWLAVAALLFLLAMTPVAGPRGLVELTATEALAKHALYGGAALALLLPLTLAPNGRSAWQRLLETAPARWTGRVSYGVFLWHLVALDAVFRFTPLDVFTGHTLLVLALALPLSLSLAALSLRAVEEPALRRKRPAQVDS